MWYKTNIGWAFFNIGICLIQKVVCNEENTTAVILEETTTDADFNNSAAEGRAAGEGEFPFQVSIHYSYNDEFICGGSIVSTNMVVTAGHCMYYTWGGILPPLIITVHAGTSNLNDTTSKQFEVNNIQFHPFFNRTTMNYDLALLEIKDHFPSNSSIEKVSLDKNLPGSYDNCLVTGWNQDSDDLRVSEVEIVECGDIYSNDMGIICSQNKLNSQSLCKIGAGSSLLCEDNLIGILSIAPNCNASSQLAVFESTRNSLTWFKQQGLSSADTKNHNNMTWRMILAILFFVLQIFSM